MAERQIAVGAVGQRHVIPSLVSLEAYVAHVPQGNVSPGHSLILLRCSGGGGVLRQRGC